MGILKDLRPWALWMYFEEICRIPRISRNEERIRQYLLEFAAKHNLESKEDSTGNILITRKAAPGFEKVKPLVLQSHMDMVGEKNADHPHNWKTDPITPVIRNGWVSASGTTLGADDGVGIAAQLAVLTDEKIHAGEIECLFTVDEESGMTGAVNLQPEFIKGRTLLNLDSEDEGILYIGCAGGMDTVGTIRYNPVPVSSDDIAVELSVTGLRGGHSGDEIHKGLGNAVKIMNGLLRELSANTGARLSHINAGNLRNAIAREAFALITIEPDNLEQLLQLVNNYEELIADELRNIDPDLRISAKPAGMPEFVIDDKSQSLLIEVLECCPHGVIRWSAEMDDLVQTSTNLASAKSSEGNTIVIITTQRSSVDREKHEAGEMVAACLRKAGANIKQSEGYPGWQPDINSEILAVTTNAYRKLFGNEPLVRAIHAGLECGLIHEKVRNIDMISFGPTIRGAHTPEEKIEIASAERFWDLLLEVIHSMSEIKA